jgi:hypothetical protein
MLKNGAAVETPPLKNFETSYAMSHGMGQGELFSRVFIISQGDHIGLA